MGALTDLDVDRVDAVDAPAHRRRFLIRKAEGDGTAPAAAATTTTPAADPAGEAAAAAVEAAAIVKAAQSLVGTIRKADGLALDDVTVDALNALIAATPDGGEPFAKSAAAAPAPAAAPAAGAPAAPQFDEATITVLADAVAKSLTARLDAETPAPETTPDPWTAPTPSMQPAGQTPVAKSGGPRKMGDGLFGNIVNGR